MLGGELYAESETCLVNLAYVRGEIGCVCGEAVKRFTKRAIRERRHGVNFDGESSGNACRVF